MLLSIGGVNNDTIESVEFLLKPSNTPIPNLSIISAEVCNQTEPFEVCAIVKYTDCPDKKTPVKTVYPCGNNQPIITCLGFYKSDDGYCIKAEIGGTLIDDYTIQSFTINGQAYTEGDEVCGFDPGDVIEFTAIIDFDDPCQPISIEHECLIPIPNGDCSLNNASIECIIEDGCCKPKLIIECLVEQPKNVFFWYYIGTNEPGDDDYGCLWNGKECLIPGEGEKIYWKAEISFCGACNNYCIDWVDCEKENDCDCEIGFKCLDCKIFAQIVSGCEGGGDILLFKSLSGNDENNKPTYNPQSDILIDTIGPDGVAIDKDLGCWYFIVLKIEGCFDTVECYYFNPNDPVQGNTNVIID